MPNPKLPAIVRAAQVAALSLALAACVTINVYFPTAAAEKAADQIIDAVTGQQGGAARPQGGRTPAAPPIGHRPAAAPAQPSLLALTVGRALYALVPVAHAQQANLDISSPEIRAVTASMQARFGQLERHFDSGVLGMTQDGLIQARDTSAVPLAERAVVTRLVAEDNRDRATLYAEIARANGHPEWEADIRRTFARRWVERGARAGWYYQDAAGGWVRK